MDINFVALSKCKCAVPENIHTSPAEGIEISWGVGGSVRPKNVKKCMRLNWNFQMVGEGCFKKQSLLWGRYGYFLQLHNYSMLLHVLSNKCFSFARYHSVTALAGNVSHLLSSALFPQGVTYPQG